MTFLERLGSTGAAERTFFTNARVALSSGQATLWVTALVCLEFITLRALSTGRFLALSEAENGAALLVAHTMAKSLVPAFLFIAWIALIRHRGRPAAIQGRALWTGLTGLNVLAFAALLLILPVLPVGEAVPMRLSASEALFYSAAIGSLVVVIGSGISLLWPREMPASRTLLAAGALFLATAIYRGQLSEVVDTARGLIEGTALDLSLWFYGLSGRPLPAIDASGPNPVMSSEGFAISIAPSCSGYQGMISAFVLLGAYIGLERRALRLDRALLLCTLAIGGTFVLNAVRIAVLFYIGEDVSPEIAVNGFHSQFGTLALLATSGLAILLMELRPFRVLDSAAATSQGPPRFDLMRPALLMLPLAAYLLAGMITGLFIGSFNWLYPVPVLVGAGLLWALRGHFKSVLSVPPSLTAITVGVGVFILWIALISPDGNRAALFRETLSAVPIWLAAGWVIFRVIGSSLVVPLVEELAFRRGLFRLLEHILSFGLGPKATTALTLLGTSLAFGLLHADILAATLAGAAYGTLYLWRRALTDAILAHVVTNFLICLYVLGLDQWSYW